MWEQIEHDNTDMTWLATALANGTVMAVTDGSYNKSAAPQISGAGWIIYCFRTGKQIRTGSFYEISPFASSYHGKLLGLLALHVILYTMETHYSLKSAPTNIWCDCKGALHASKCCQKHIGTGTNMLTSSVLSVQSANEHEQNTNTCTFQHIRMT